MAGYRVSNYIQRGIEELQKDPDFLAETTAITIVEQILGVMEKKGLTKAELARRMGVSRAHVSKLFKAPPNMTLRSIAHLAIALDTSFHFRLSKSCATHEASDRAAWSQPDESRVWRAAASYPYSTKAVAASMGRGDPEFLARFGARVKEARTAASLSPDLVGQQLGVTQHTVRYWEAGRQLPKLSHLIGLAGLYNRPVDWLLETSPSSGPLNQE